MFWFFGQEAWRILAAWPGIEPVTALEVLTIGLPGKSPRDHAFVKKTTKKVSWMNPIVSSSSGCSSLIHAAVRATFLCGKYQGTGRLSGPSQLTSRASAMQLLYPFHPCQMLHPLSSFNAHSILVRRFNVRLFLESCSVAQSCSSLCDPMDCSTPGFPVLYYLPEFAQARVHWVNGAIQPSHLLLPPSPPALVFSSINVFYNVLAVGIRWPKYWSFSFSISPSSEYSEFISFRIDWFDLLAVQGQINEKDPVSFMSLTSPYHYSNVLETSCSKNFINPLFVFHDWSGFFFFFLMLCFVIPFFLSCCPSDSPRVWLMPFGIFYSCSPSS